MGASVWAAKGKLAPILFARINLMPQNCLLFCCIKLGDVDDGGDDYDDGHHEDDDDDIKAADFASLKSLKQTNCGRKFAAPKVATRRRKSCASQIILMDSQVGLFTLCERVARLVCLSACASGWPSARLGAPKLTVSGPPPTRQSHFLSSFRSPSGPQ